MFLLNLAVIGILLFWDDLLRPFELSKIIQQSVIGARALTYKLYVAFFKTTTSGISAVAKQ